MPAAVIHVSLAVSQRIQRVKPSPTVALTGRVAQLKAAGRDIISLGAGEPDFDTPEYIARAAMEAIRRGFTHYTPVEGIADLRDAIVVKFRRDNGIDYGREQILVSSGAKQTIFNLVMAVVNPGDEVVIPAPYWVSYPDMTLLADGVPVTPYAGPDQRYKLSPGQLEQAIGPRTRLFILNSPNNPTGAAYSAAELKAFGEVLTRHPQVIIATDDIYEHIYWGDEPYHSLLTVCPQLYDRTVTINGVSKAYAMTGWRIGYCGGPQEIVRAMATIQGQSTSNAGSISQHAALAALLGDQSCIAHMKHEFKRRHDCIVAGLNRLRGIACLPGDGTFYALAEVAEAIATLGLADDNAFAEYLLDNAAVAVVAGSGFGAPAHVRLSYACGIETLNEALGRLEAVLGSR